MKKTTTYRQSKPESLFEEEFTLKALSAMGNPLEQVSALVDFEFFRPTLEKTLLTEDCKTSAGRRPIDVVLMFKVIFLQRYYGLGDHQIEYQIIDATFVEALGSVTLAGKTLPSRTAREMSFGTTTHTRNATRTLTHVGLRNGMRNYSFPIPFFSDRLIHLITN